MMPLARSLPRRGSLRCNAKRCAVGYGWHGGLRAANRGAPQPQGWQVPWRQEPDVELGAERGLRRLSVTRIDPAHLEPVGDHRAAELASTITVGSTLEEALSIALDAGFQMTVFPISAGAVGRLPAIAVKLNGVIA